MPIVVLGTSYKTAPLALRERLVFAGHSLVESLQLLVSQYAQEGVIISTCHRTEVYAVVSGSQQFAPRDFLIEAKGVSNEELDQVLYHYFDEKAIPHLYRVASGLESAVLGEPEVLGQVRQAMEEARAVGACGPILGRLFNGAVACGKRVRTETEIAWEPLSLSTMAVSLAEKTLGTLQGRRVLVVGAGKMGMKALNYLLAEGSQVTVVNRNPQKARARGQFGPAQIVGFEALESTIPEVDLIISSTSAPHPVITKDAVKKALAKRPDRGLMLIDLALPRDVAPEVREISRVKLVDIDELSQLVESNLQRRRGELPKAEAIVEQEAVAFLQWYYSRQVIPTLQRLQEHSRKIRDQEVARALRRLGRASPQQIKVIEEMASRIVNKLLHNPTLRLKEEAGRGNGLLYSEALHVLFGLREDDDE